MELEERLFGLERRLSTLTGHEGWVIGKCRFVFSTLEKEVVYDSPYQMDILRENRNLAEIRIQRHDDVERLDVTLMKPVEHSRWEIGKKKHDSKTWSERGQISGEGKVGNDPVQTEIFCVTREETDHYLAASGDKNPIHRGENSIVPGFLMVNRIAGLLKTPERSPEKLQVRFFSPLPVGEAAELMISGQPEKKINAEVYWNGTLILRIEAE